MSSPSISSTGGSVHLYRLVSSHSGNVGSIFSDHTQRLRKKVKPIISAILKKEMRRSGKRQKRRSSAPPQHSHRKSCGSNAKLWTRLIEQGQDLLDNQQDRKFQQLKILVNTIRAEHPEDKIIIFTEFTDTLRFLEKSSLLIISSSRRSPGDCHLKRRKNRHGFSRNGLISFWIRKQPGKD